MLRVKDVRGESIVVDNGFVEKYRLDDMRGRAPVSDYVGTEVKQRPEVDALIAELEQQRDAQR